MRKSVLSALFFTILFVMTLLTPASAINYFSVPIDSYDSFRNATFGKGYDIDGSWGYQCWDGAALFWQQLGMWLATGDGYARGCWNLKREANAGDKFQLIYTTF